MTAAPAEPLALLRPDHESDLFAADPTGPVLSLCWFCEPEDQPAVPPGADYTFAVCRSCQERHR